MPTEPNERPTRFVSPGNLALVDQLAAELADLVAVARRHMAGCPTLPAGVCIGKALQNAILALSCKRRDCLLEEAIAQLARADPGSTVERR
jgi:hypothetical protein